LHCLFFSGGKKVRVSSGQEFLKNGASRLTLTGRKTRGYLCLKRKDSAGYRG